MPRPTKHVPAASPLPSRSPVERGHAAADTTETCEVAAKYTLVSVLARGHRCGSAPRGLYLLVRQGPWIEDVHSAPLHCRVEHILQDVAPRFGEPVEHQYLADAEKKLSSVKHLLLLSSSLRAALDPDCWRWRTLCSSRWTFGTTRSSAEPLAASCAWPGTFSLACQLHVPRLLVLLAVCSIPGLALFPAAMSFTHVRRLSDAVACTARCAHNRLAGLVVCDDGGICLRSLHSSRRTLPRVQLLRPTESSGGLLLRRWLGQRTQSSLLESISFLVLIISDSY